MRVSVSLALAISAALVAAPARAQSPAPGTVASAPAAVPASPAAEDSARRVAIDKLTAFVARYPASPLRPNALFQLAELLVRRADDAFAVAQRSGSGNDVTQPDYSAAVSRYEELVAKYPGFVNSDAAAYTLGTLYSADGRYADAAKMLEVVTAKPQSTYRPEAFFRLGDARFEQASSLRGAPRRAMFVQAADAYENATKTASPDGDILLPGALQAGLGLL